MFCFVFFTYGMSRLCNPFTSHNFNSFVNLHQHKITWFFIIISYLSRWAPSIIIIIFFFLLWRLVNKKTTHTLLLCPSQSDIQQQTDGKHEVDCWQLFHPVSSKAQPAHIPVEFLPRLRNEESLDCHVVIVPPFKQPTAHSRIRDSVLNGYSEERETERESFPIFGISQA